jgi:hypothetical protein
MRTKSALWMGLCAVGVVLGACSDAGEGAGGEPLADELPFTSDQATLLKFEFDGEFVSSSSFNLEQSAKDQLLYTIGHLNGDRAVGRLDKLVITNIKATRQDDGRNLVKYHAVMPVGWGSKTNLPKSYALVIPRDVDFDGLERFTESYGHGSCVDFGAHDVDSGSMWYYYRPNQSGCTLADADVVRFNATVTVSPENTEGKYPEYHKVWEDNELSVIAIFGKFEDGATTASDAGISAYNKFVSTIRTSFKTKQTVTPANTPSTAGVGFPDVTITAELEGGRKLNVTALLVDNVASTGPAFDTRYSSLSGNADMIFYNGHAGLGQNVRALAKKGKFLPGKYQVFFMNGCDTFAYVDGHLATTRALINPDDPTGTKYMDMVTNVMPSFFHSMPNASLAMIRGLLSRDTPKTYQEIFKDIDRSEVVVVTGEEDNVFKPGGPVQEAWTLTQKSSVARGEMVTFVTPATLPAGEYTIAIVEDAAAPGGDADLYIGLGKVPTLSTYDFRPWLDGSNEEVRFTLTAPTKVNVMVHGYEDASQATASFTLTGKKTK